MPVKRALAVAGACLAAAAIALAVTVAATSAATSAQDPPPSGGSDTPLKSWDTDNLAAGSVGAKNYRIPFHNYNGERLEAYAKACYRIVHPGSLIYQPSKYDGTCQYSYTVLTLGCYIGPGQVSTPFVYPVVGWYEIGCPGVHNRVNWQVCGTSAPYSVSRDCAADGLVRTTVLGGIRHAGCRSAVADAFFQTGGDTGAVNDFPVLEYGSEETAATVTGTGERDSGCADFAEQQDRLVSSMAANGGWYLDSEGNLRKNAGEVPARVLARPAAVYGTWAAKGANYYHLARYQTAFTYPSAESYRSLAADDSSYDLRADQRNDLAMAAGLPRTGIHPWNTNIRPAGSGRTVRCSWPAEGPQSAIVGCYDLTAWAADTKAPLLKSFASFAVAARSGLKSYVNKTYGYAWFGGAVWVNAATMNSRLVHLTASHDSGDSLCPAGWHPRGQDGVYTIGPSTGRTLSSINTEPEVKAADAHWCRSDVRYTLKFKAQQHNTCGSDQRFACPAPTGVSVPAAGDNFSSYGRKNCYKTMTGYNETNAECEYVFPLPKCDPDPDNNSRTDWREFTPAEVDNIGVDGEPLLVEEGAYCGTNINPPDLAGLDADACVVVDVAVSDKVVVFDLDVSAGTQRNKLCV